MEIIKDCYISKLEVVRILQKAYAEGRISAIDDCASVLDDINAIPASDVQSVRQGVWLCVGHDDTSYWYRCSVCGHEEHDNMTKHDRFCSNCGSIMRGVENG